jgi:hypothetical protein
MFADVIGHDHREPALRILTRKIGGRKKLRMGDLADRRRPGKQERDFPPVPPKPATVNCS